MYLLARMRLQFDIITRGCQNVFGRIVEVIHMRLAYPAVLIKPNTCSASRFPFGTVVKGCPLHVLPERIALVH